MCIHTKLKVRGNNNELFQKKKFRNSRGQLKKNSCGKTHVEFPQVLVFDVGISKGCHTILQNF